MPFDLIVYLSRGKQLAYVCHPPPASMPRPWGNLLTVLVSTAAYFFAVPASNTP
ncbi:MAG: hypothetical protein PHQ04_05480 [Opitutaceae bacterium]|nr:hypothetical protein [Opitutaceae bacterium]